MAALDQGILKIGSATKEAGHKAHIDHEAGFRDSGVIIRFKLPGLNKKESFLLSFVDREAKGVWAGHLAYGMVSLQGLGLIDRKTGMMNLKIRKLRQEYKQKKQAVPKEIVELLKTKTTSVNYKLVRDRHEMVLVTKGDQMRMSIDGKLVLSHRSEG